MNKWIIALSFFLLGNYYLSAQVKFFPYSEALIKKAKEENKLIFYEFRATWCGPCVMMERFVFSDPKVGAAYNDNFICIKIDIDDDPQNISEKIKTIPAFAFVEPTGEMIYFQSGDYDVDEVIKFREIPLAYKNGTTTAAQDLIITLNKKPEQAEENLRKFMAGDDWKKREAARLLLDMASGSQKANGYKNIHDHFDKETSTYTNLVGQERVDSFLANRVLQGAKDEIEAALYENREPNWANISIELKEKLGDRYLKHLYEIKALYFFYAEDLLKFVDYTLKATEEFVKYKKTPNEKASYYCKAGLNIINDQYDMEGDISAEDEDKAFEVACTLLKKAETLFDEPSAKFYGELASVCSILGKKEEAEKYKKLAEQAKN